ncbi:MAG: hypothetical protein JWQ89_330 [Devosia sp.]|uniref:hypothetical protein n=1 Tax=Devosia sp. TaxID=1871048 RepID=UPI002639089B|nr:hypothetical protein [Devosia sp.]MDB5538603.1 hypothetical protein [Devosia sp.]
MNRRTMIIGAAGAALATTTPVAVLAAVQPAVPLSAPVVAALEPPLSELGIAYIIATLKTATPELRSEYLRRVRDTAGLLDAPGEEDVQKFADALERWMATL